MGVKDNKIREMLDDGRMAIIIPDKDTVIITELPIVNRVQIENIEILSIDEYNKKYKE